MKSPRLSALILIVMLRTVNLPAQIEIVPLAGYTFRSAYYEGPQSIVFDEGFTYGGLLLYRMNSGAVGISFLSQESKASPQNPFVEEHDIPAGISHYQLAYLHYFDPFQNDRFLPYLGVNLGITQFYDKTENLTQSVQASFGFNGGVSFNINHIFSLRVHGQMESPIPGLGTSVGYGTTGVNIGPSAISSFIQFGIMGGIGFRLGLDPLSEE